VNPYVGEIRMFAGNFAPQGWAFCDGSLLAIADYTPLYDLIGTTYGGDGQTTFALPNLLGRVPVHQANGFSLGQSAGSEEVTLTQSQLPTHSHVPQAARTTQGVNTPAGNVWAASPEYAEYGPAPDSSMSAQALASTGGGQPHDNMVPYLAINFIIALFGIFPSQ
jgi:microcystin-dependent protein